MNRGNSSIIPKSRAQFISENLNFKWIVLIFIVLIVVCINEIFLRTLYPSSDRQLRDLSHILAGILMPHFIQVFSGTINNHFGMAKVYAFACLILELLDIHNHGYFQGDQYLSDLVGVGICLIFVYFTRPKSS